MKKNFIMIILFFIVTSVCSCMTSEGSKAREAGKRYYRQADYENSYKKFSEAIEKGQNHWILYLYRGMAYKKSNKIDLAIFDLSKALELLPTVKKWHSKSPHDKRAELYVIRGQLYYEKGMVKAALKDFNQSLNLNPKSIDAYYYRAKTKEQMNKNQEAVEDYSVVINIMSRSMSGVSDENKIMIYLNRANTYRKMNKLDSALTDNNQALKIDKDWNAFLSRGITLAKMEKFNEAIKDFDRAIELNPSSETAYLYRASSRMLSNCDLERILEDYYSLIAIKTIDKNTLLQGYNQIAWILSTATNEKVRNGKEALKYAKKSIEIDKNHMNMDTLAVAYAECGEYGQAIDIVKQAIALCETSNPELLPDIEKHLESFVQKKPIREDCPGKNAELKQLKNWQTGSVL